MNGIQVILLIAFILGVNALVWYLLGRRFRAQLARLAVEIAEAGEHTVVGPAIAYGVSYKGVVTAKTSGVLALTDRRLIFRKPIGADLSIPRSEIASVDETTWFQGNYRNGQKFAIVKRADGFEVGFQMRSHDRWMSELRQAIAPKLGEAQTEKPTEVNAEQPASTEQKIGQTGD